MAKGHWRITRFYMIVGDTTSKEGAKRLAFSSQGAAIRESKKEIYKGQTWYIEDAETGEVIATSQS